MILKYYWCGRINIHYIVTYIKQTFNINLNLNNFAKVKNLVCEIYKNFISCVEIKYEKMYMK